MEDTVETTTEYRDLEWGYENPQLVVKIIKDNLSLMEGFDEEKVLKGHVFERILNDDVGNFGAAALFFETEIRKPGRAVELKTTFLNRLRWEEEQPQTPQAIKDAIVELRKEVDGREWDTEENVRADRALWEKAVLSKAKPIIDGNEEGAGEALAEYYRYMEEARKRSSAPRT